MVAPGDGESYAASPRFAAIELVGPEIVPALENPSWRSVFDLDPDCAATTRRELLDRAAADKVSVIAYHFPFPGMGRVESRGDAWAWEAGADPSFRAA